MSQNLLDKIDLPNLKSAVNFSNIGLFILDKKMHIIHWGEGMERLYDVAESEVIDKHVLDKFSILEEEGIYHKFIDAAKTGKSFELLARSHLSLKKGKRFIDFNISPLRDEETNIIGVNVLLIDVTDRKQDETALREYEQFTTNILDDAAEAIFVLDENDCVKVWNKQAAKMYGYSAEEIIGKPISLIVPDDRQSQEEINA